MEILNMKNLENLINDKINATPYITEDVETSGMFVDISNMVEDVRAYVHPDGEQYGCDLFHWNYEPITNVYGHAPTKAGAILNALEQLVGLENIEVA